MCRRDEPGPVSYTHLDVYKRQASEPLRILFQGLHWGRSVSSVRRGLHMNQNQLCRRTQGVQPSLHLPELQYILPGTHRSQLRSYHRGG